MRIISGICGGLRVTAPPGLDTRPTADRVKESLFGMLGDLGGQRVLDLFAGSGALGGVRGQTYYLQLTSAWSVGTWGARKHRDR